MNGTIEKIKDCKKLIEKIKRVCTSISKFNLNSPCLLQFVRVNGEYEVILTHNPVNGDRLDFYKIFSTVTKDNFYIGPEDADCFKCGDDRVSVPIIISTFDFINKNLSPEKHNLRNVQYYADLKYDLCLDSFYVFPKFVLKAIKEEKIFDFEIVQRSKYNNIYTFNMDIIYDNNDKRFANTLFIRNSEKLNYLYNIYILPFGTGNSGLQDIYNKHNRDIVSYIHLDPKIWEEIYMLNRYNSAINLKGANNQDILVYQNDFMQKKIVDGTITKHYESERGNIVSLYFDITLPNNIHEYFKYRYYEIGAYNL